MLLVIVVNLSWMVKKLTYVSPARLPQIQTPRERTVDISDRIVTVSPHQRWTYAILESVITEIDEHVVLVVVSV